MIKEFKIFERIKNEKYANSVFKDILNDISKLYNLVNTSIQTPTFKISEEGKIGYIINDWNKNTYMVLDLLTFKLMSDEIKDKITKILTKHQKKLKNQNILLSFGAFRYGFKIYYKDIITERVKPDKYYYHATSNSNLEKILKEGLLPKENTFWGVELDYPAVIFVSNKYNLFFGEVLLRITTSKTDNKWYKDINEESGRYMTFEKIPPESLNIVKEKWSDITE